MVAINKLEVDNVESIIEWNKERDAAFLEQWAGRGYCYPLTKRQILDRQKEGAEIYEAVLDGKMIGTIEIVSRDNQEKSAHIGRFVLDPSLQGKGLGTNVLQALLDYCKKEYGMVKVTLSVFDFNVAAYRCYQKCGFIERERFERPNGWTVINMEKEIQ